MIAVNCHIKMIILGCDLENCFGTFYAALATHETGFRAAAHHVIRRHFTHTHRLLQFFVSLYCSLWTRAIMCLFSHFICLIGPGNVDPTSMYKIN